MSKKITSIIVETEQIVVRRSRFRSPAHPPAQVIETWCDDCSTFARMVTPEQAALLTRISARTIYRRAEAGELHFAETAEGLFFICLDSLTT